MPKALQRGEQMPTFDNLERVARETAEQFVGKYRRLLNADFENTEKVVSGLLSEVILAALRQFEPLPGCGHARSEWFHPQSEDKGFCCACERTRAKVEDARNEGILIGRGLAEVAAGYFRSLKEIKKELKMRAESTPGDTPSTMISRTEADARVQAAVVEMRERCAKVLDDEISEREKHEDFLTPITELGEMIRALPTPIDALDTLLTREWECGHADGLENACSAAVASYIDALLAKAREEGARSVFDMSAEAYAEAIRARGKEQE